MNKASQMTREEINTAIREPLSGQKGSNGIYSLPVYLDRLDELFGPDWNQIIQDTKSGVRCEIEISCTCNDGRYYIERSVIERDSNAAIRLCCYVIGVGGRS